ncbi:MAG: hypothetical protein R2856_39700, partial [Caldilineaceae bacterium]
WALHAQLARLEPMGQDNPPPLFCTRHCYVREVRTVGKEKSHLKLTIGAPGEYVFDAIAFNLGALADQLESGLHVDLVYQLEVNEWNGRRALQMNVQDLRIAE